MSKPRSFKVSLTITGTLNFSPEEVINLISYMNEKRTFVGRELTEENFDEFVTRAIRKQIRQDVRDGVDLALDTLVRREAKVVITPKGQPKVDSTGIAKTACPFPTTSK